MATNPQPPLKEGEAPAPAPSPTPPPETDPGGATVPGTENAKDAPSATTDDSDAKYKMGEGSTPEPVDPEAPPSGDVLKHLKGVR